MSANKSSVSYTESLLKSSSKKPYKKEKILTFE